MMKIYLASRYIRREEMVGYAAELRVIGHEITSRWINGGHQIPHGLGHGVDVDFARRFANEDVEDIIAADCLIAFTETEGDGYTGRGGRHVEFGLGLAMYKEIVVVGYRENVFCYLPQVHYFAQWQDALGSYFTTRWEMESLRCPTP